MMGNVPEMEDEEPTVKLPDEHTALFAPLGYPVEAAYGTLTVKPSMPPQSANAQVDWSEKQPYIFNLNNKSLVDEYFVSPSLNDWASEQGMLMRSAVHRLRMFRVFMCIFSVLFGVLFASPNLRKKLELPTS